MSAIVAGLLFVNLLLLPTTFDAPGSTAAILIVFGAGIVTIVLNRASRVTVAGYLMVIVLMLAIALVFVTATNGIVSLDYFPVYDLLTIPLVVAASVLPASQVFVVATANIAFIVGDVLLQPHGSLNINTPDGYSLVAKPIVLQIIIAVVSYLWVRSMTRAIARADRAEELASLEHAVATQRQQLEVGVQQILETHVRIANGDYAARAPLSQDHLLWQISSSLNNLMGRLQKSGAAEHQLRRTEDELRRLAAAIDDVQAGKRPIWPASSGTAADLIIERISGRNRPSPGLAQGQQRPPLPPGYAPNAPYPEPQRYGGGMGPLGATGALHTPGTGPLEAPDFPVWQPSGPFSNPMQNPAQNPPQGPRTSADGAPENPWFLTPDA